MDVHAAIGLIQQDRLIQLVLPVFFVAIIVTVSLSPRTPACQAICWSRR